MTDFHLKGLITIKDIEKADKYPNSARDEYWSAALWRSHWRYRRRS